MCVYTYMYICIYRYILTNNSPNIDRYIDIDISYSLRKYIYIRLNKTGISPPHPPAPETLLGSQGYLVTQ